MGERERLLKILHLTTAARQPCGKNGHPVLALLPRAFTSFASVERGIAGGENVGCGFIKLDI
jgi:hypothetical protein